MAARRKLATAPSWYGPARLPVEVLGRAKNGRVLVRWLDGPLRGREAGLEASTLRAAEGDPPLQENVIR